MTLLYTGFFTSSLHLKFFSSLFILLWRHQGQFMLFLENFGQIKNWKFVNISFIYHFISEKKNILTVEKFLFVLLWRHKAIFGVLKKLFILFAHTFSAAISSVVGIFGFWKQFWNLEKKCQTGGHFKIFEFWLQGGQKRHWKLI